MIPQKATQKFMSNQQKIKRRAPKSKQFKMDVVQYNEADAQALGKLLHDLKIPAAPPQTMMPLAELAKNLHDVVEANPKMNPQVKLVLACFQRRILDIGNVMRELMRLTIENTSAEITDELPQANGEPADSVPGDAPKGS